MNKAFASIICILSVHFSSFAQGTDINTIDYKKPKEYVIADITVSGVENLDKNILVSMSGLRIGDKITIPGEKATQVIKKFWKQGLFEDVKLSITKEVGLDVYLNIHLQERPRVANLEIKGVNKSDQDDIKEKLSLKRGSQVTENEMNKAVYYIQEYYKEKGFFNTDVDIQQERDTVYKNRVDLTFEISKNKKVKIEEIVFFGNSAYDTKKLRRVMKKTKQRDWNIFKGSKYLEENLEEDFESLYSFYNENGYRDFKIITDSIRVLNEKRMNLYISINEGDKYYFRNITWIGNTVYPSDMLDYYLGIEKGDVYNKTMLNKRLNSDDDAISALYMDNGYLFFNLTPVEKKIEGDSIDIDMIMVEDKQATINSIVIKGNTKTNEHVVRRELMTRPGELFSREELIRSVRELAQLGHFNPETINPIPIPNHAEGTVDIEYNLEEKANDQLELSGGWGGYSGFIGTIGVRFSNFSASRFFDPQAWRPIPSGDGQTLSLRASSNGRYYRGVNFSFIEPWLGGTKPHNFSVSINRTKYELLENFFDRDSDIEGSLGVWGGSIGFGRRLRWPDNYFQLTHLMSYQRYNNNNYQSRYYSFLDRNGVFEIISLTNTLTRNSTDQIIYPRRGSKFSLSLETTPPFSLISNKINSKLIEYHKWQYESKWFHTLVNKLVLHVGMDLGVLGYYNKDRGYPAMGAFLVGEDLMQGMHQYGIDLVQVRGYKNGALSPVTLNAKNKPITKANIYNKYTTELRYLISPNPQATFYGLVFAEGGNGWFELKDFNPFEIKRSAGVGLRAFLPMFGMLGIDVGYGFDRSYRYVQGSDVDGAGRGWTFHFNLGQSF
jgi:outer membrane protein insertion porin family